MQWDSDMAVVQLDSDAIQERKVMCCPTLLIATLAGQGCCHRQ